MTDHNRQSQGPPRLKVIHNLILLLIATIVATNFDSFVPYFRRLPTDEEMVANFHKHRGDFERLARIYREDPIPVNSLGYVLPTPEIQAVMERINVVHGNTDYVVWIPPDPYADWVRPDPYSGPNEFEQERSRFKLKCDFPCRESRKYSGVVLTSGPGVVKSLTYNRIKKSYYYTPFPPKIIDGRLVVPATLLTGGSGGIYPTLTKLPAGFKSGDAIYRQIEPHWYIMMYQYVDDD
jgi:hypothetical protein